MRILLLSDFFPPVRGGLEFHVDSLASALSDRGHVVAVATLTPRATPTHPAVQAFTIRALASWVLPHATRDRPFHPPVPDPLAAADIGKVLRVFRPDIVHGHSWLAVSLPRRLKVPLVLTAHDYGVVCQLRTLVRRDGSLCVGPSTACFKCGSSRLGLAKSGMLSLGTPLGRRWLSPDHLIAVSSTVADAIRGRFDCETTVIPNFIPDIPETAPIPVLGIPPQPYVMFAGDPSPHKGLQWLLDIWRDDYPPAADLLIAATRQFDSKLPPRVTVLQLDRPQVASALASALVAVVPSLWPDPFPTIALEAMAAGTPVIANRVGGLTDMYQNGVQGFLIEPGDGVEFRGRLDELLRDPATCSRMGQAAHAHVERFQARSVVPLIESIYDGCL
jgi:glycosyltransferase involved in cell wall biosynthesis